VIAETLHKLYEEKDWPPVTLIVSGMAKGADTAAITFAHVVGLPVEQIPTNWKEYGRVAGSIRNGQMADLADYFIGFWDGESRGTAQMMRCVAIRKKPLHMVVRRRGAKSGKLVDIVMGQEIKNV
jgi:hypothetical protein